MNEHIKNIDLKDIKVGAEIHINMAYQKGVNDFVDYLNQNAFELRHDMELIQKYAEKFIGNIL